MKKRTVGVGLTLVIICLFALLLMAKSNQSPYDYLKKNAGSSNATAANEFLYQANIGEKEYAIFYINKKNKASCAIMKKTLFSYSILEISTGVSLVNNSKRVDFLFSSYNGGHNWIDWGIVHDNEIKQVLVNDRAAYIINIDGYSFKICYLLGNETEKTIPPNHVLVE